MGPVARDLLGEPNGKLSSKVELRFGSHGSMSVDLAKGTWFDHEAGEGGGVLDLLRVRRGLVNGAGMAWLEERGHLAPKDQAKPGRPRQVAAYAYTDADGAVLFEVCRFEPKTFRQRRPDGRGGWHWDMQGVQRVPYKLPDVLGAISAGEPVFIVEGEKAADLLAAAGLAATCSPGGAGKWALAYAEWFNGADVVVLPDNDDVGRRHADTVADSLAGRARRVRLLPLSELPDKGDVADWLAAGGTAEQLFDLAEAAPVRAAQASKPVSGAAAANPYRLDLVDPRTLAGVPIPVREWIIEDWLPFGHVTLSYGDGGVGKTLLAQQLMASCATGAYWLGLTPRRCKVFGLFCEDDPDEVHRRQDRINDALGIDWADLGDMRWACAVGQDNVLVRFEADGSWNTTPRFDQIIKAAKDFGAQLIVIDTAADTFGGNENDRQQVRAYLGPVLTRLARDIGGAVLVNAHPSRSGMSSTGDLDGGSTAWSNTARSRWSLTRPMAEEGAEPDPNARILTRRKANYSSIGETINLRWQAGALVAQNVATGPSSSTAPSRAAAESLFLTLLDRCLEQGQAVSSSATAPNFAPRLFAKRPDRDGFSKRDFDIAMQSLFADRRIRVAEYGRPGKWRSRVERDTQNDAEDE